jgi:hypothetical protein
MQGKQKGIVEKFLSYSKSNSRIGGMTMKSKKVLWSILTVIMLLSMTVGSALAEDTDPNTLFRKNISKTPENETEKAAIYMMDFYVPAQTSEGEVKPVDNYCIAKKDDGTCEGDPAYPARDYAKPLISVYIDDLHPVETKGGITFGHFDAFVGVSLDDGTTWKTSNLSRSSALSSFTLENGYVYPGDVHNVVHQVVGDQIFVAWVSKMCDGGTPLYSVGPTKNDLLVESDQATYLTALENEYDLDAKYLYDLFGVSGTQGSVDYQAQGFPEVGEVPFSCVWTARGKLLAGNDPSTDLLNEASYVMWTKPERLTSGKRDANLPAVDCSKDAGCILTWQEDPEGLRPGQGLGPGEGWSGAIANAQTDIWYSYISFEEFDDVFTDPDDLTSENIEIEDYANAASSDPEATMPKAYVPMAMPTRLTDNAKCKGKDTTLQPSDPYCYINFDKISNFSLTNISDLLLLKSPQVDADYCATSIMWAPPGGGIEQPICVTRDERVLFGRVASTRVRLNLKPYTWDVVVTPDIPETTEDESEIITETSAWVIMAAEETKALGDILDGDSNGDGECQTTELDCDPIDIGKDVWYYSFDMFDHINIDQGGMLNQPAVCKDEDDFHCTDGLGEFYEIQIDEYENEYYLTEIARRFALTTNSVKAAMDSVSGLSAMLIYKQGIINQGGPADIMLRRLVLPTVEVDLNNCEVDDPECEPDIQTVRDFDSAVDNPYAFENMDCAEWAYTNEENGGVNPNYLKGVCLSPAINISGTTIVECTGASGNDECAAKFPVADDGSIPDDIDSFPKLLEWRQLPYDSTDQPTDPDDDSDLDDQSWENPFDVAKGHRGFLDGDIVMMMYAWSPNWKANSVGNDHYNLYVRRSFDGGLTWTTTPADATNYPCGLADSTDIEGNPITVSTACSGTTAVENYCVGLTAEECATNGATEFVYAAGALEQGRNVSQLIGNKVTILDPRYTPTGGLKLYPEIKNYWMEDNNVIFTSEDVLPYDDDAGRARDKFFIIYETGDNTTVTEGEAVPLDLFYSRATSYGDVYEEMLYDATGSTQDPYWAWPWLEKDKEDLSGEASVVANPGGTFMYAVWNQWKEEILDDGHELVFDSDMIFRRLMYNFDTTVALTDLPPVASLLAGFEEFFNTEDDDVISLYVSARDLDTFGDDPQIVEYEWLINGQPFTYNADGISDCYQSPQCKAPTRVLVSSWDGYQFTQPGWSGPEGNYNYGWYEFQVRAKDNEGHWTKILKTKKYIGKTAADVPFVGFKIFLPLTTK